MQDDHVALQATLMMVKPLATPSGKIEIYSAELAWRAANWDQENSPLNPTGVKGDTITAIPQYTVTWDGYEDEDTKDGLPNSISGLPH